MTDTTTKGPTPEAYQAACDALWVHRDRADALTAGLEAIRAWRHMQPHAAGPEFGPLDAVLDSLALDGDDPVRQIARPTTLPEAIAAYRGAMTARRRALAAARLVWDQIEAAAMREIDRHLPHGKG
jgi:hypothetical protein